MTGSVIECKRYFQMRLNKTQCANIKGIAILTIVIHNFTSHLLNIESNEMVYNQHITDYFMNNIWSADALWLWFSFLGWCAVAAFFFLSGYGLAIKYDIRDINHKKYISHHLVKLWKLLIPVYLIYVLVYHFYFQHNYSFLVFTGHLTFTINFFIYKSYTLEPGPYWFFGAILQLYFLFLFIRKLNIKWLITLCAIFILYYYIVLYSGDKQLSLWSRVNFLGWATPFIMGIIYAKSSATIALSRPTIATLCVLSLVMCFISMTNKPMVPLTEVFAVTFFICFVKLFSFKIFTILGAISASLFVVHPFFRMLFLEYSHSSCHTTTATLCYLMITLLFSWIHDKFKSLK